MISYSGRFNWEEVQLWKGIPPTMKLTASCSLVPIWAYPFLKSRLDQSPMDVPYAKLLQSN